MVLFSKLAEDWGLASLIRCEFATEQFAAEEPYVEQLWWTPQISCGCATIDVDFQKTHVGPYTHVLEPHKSI